jgi:hypothetical protein
MSPELVAMSLVDRLDSEVLTRSRFAREPYCHEAFYDLRRWRDYDLLIPGNAHTTYPAGQRKWVDLDEFPVPTAERSRRYLHDIFELQRPAHAGMASERVPWATADLELLAAQPPKWFAGRAVRSRPGAELAYVDLRAAYWQLYRLTTLDLFFSPAPPILALGRLAFLDSEELGADKDLRNAVVGSIRVRHYRVMGAAGERRCPLFNAVLAPGLWGYMMYTLHAVAAEVRAHFQAVYVCCDGYIVPAALADPLIAWLRQEWALEASVRARGPGVVYGLGSYIIGATATATHHGRQGGRIDSILQLDPGLAARLKYWRRVLVERRPSFWSTRAELEAAGGQVLRPPQVLRQSTGTPPRAWLDAEQSPPRPR